MKNFFLKVQITFSIVILLCMILLTWRQVTVINWHPTKALVLGIYYFYFFTEKWFGIGSLTASLFTFFLTWKIVSEKTSFFQNALVGTLISGIAVVLCFCISVWKIGSIDDCVPVAAALRIISFVWFELCIVGLGGWNKQNKTCQETLEIVCNNRILCVCVLSVLCISCIPIIYVGRYTFPQADDFSYGAYCYHAIQMGEGLIGALAGAVKTVVKSFLSWQGTFTSIFLMALHPGIWGTKGYHLVPLFFLIVIVSSICLFFYTVLCRICRATKLEGILTGCIVAAFAIHMVVAKPTAFFWYNGAIHYIFAFAMLLYFMIFLILGLTSQKRRGIYVGGACLSGLLCGGGNLVSALLGMIILMMSVGTLVLKKRNANFLLLPGIFMTVAFLLNVLAPGNYVRQTLSGEFVEYGVVASIQKSFQVCLGYTVSAWMDWFLLALLILLFPILLKIVNRMDFQFQLPGIFLGGSYCILSAMFTPQIFAIGQWDTGRVLNIIYFMFLILCVFNELYFIGWMEKNGKIWIPVLKNRKIRHGFLSFVFIYMGMVIVAEPERLTGSAALDAIVSGEAKEYAEVIEQNIEVLEYSEEMDVLLKMPPKEPEIFSSNEIATWKEGAAFYYGKDSTKYADK